MVAANAWFGNTGAKPPDSGHSERKADMSGEKRIGILTSGGDCAGLNAVIRAVVHRATLTYGWQVIGVKEGTMGLLSRPVQYEVLNLDMVGSSMMRQGGTILGTTNKGNPFAFPMSDGTIKDRARKLPAATAN